MSISYIAGILNYNDIGLMELFSELVNRLLVASFIRSPPNNSSPDIPTNVDHQIISSYRSQDPIEEAGLGVIMGVSTLLRDVTSLINNEMKNQGRLTNSDNQLKIEDIE